MTVRKSDTLMKRHKSRSRIDTAAAPDWWTSSPDEIEPALRRLKGVEVFEIGRSAGGRAILAAAWGPRPKIAGRTSGSLASAIAGGSPDAFYGRRDGQTLMFVGAAHGTEIEGTVAAVNMLSAIVRGRDLRGRRWPKMVEAGRKLRIVVVPLLNIDGRSRHARRRHFIGVDSEAYRRMSQGDWADGGKLDWPKSKLHHPIPLDRIAPPLGTYFNDAGVNLVYDAGFGGDAQPETAALVNLLRRESPDAVVLSHSNQGSLVQPPCSFIPAHYRQRQMQVAALVADRCRREGMTRHTLGTSPETYAGQVFYQSDMVYHCCGALPLLVEFPWGYQNVPDNHDEVLDTGMFVLEEIVAFGAAFGFRPPDPRWR